MKKFFLECMCKTELIHGEIWDAESDKNEIAKAARPLLEYLRTHYSDPDAEVQMNKDGILMVALPNVSVSFSDSKLDRRIFEELPPHGCYLDLTLTNELFGQSEQEQTKDTQF